MSEHLSSLTFDNKNVYNNKKRFLRSNKIEATHDPVVSSCYS